MSFDKPTRNALAKMVGECRRLLTADVRDQLQRTYGLQPEGTSLPIERLGHLDEAGRQRAQALREWLNHTEASEAEREADGRKAAFERISYATAFTALNRLAALRMCEEREIVLECVRRGMNSDGFILYERLAGGALGTRGEMYRVFLERMFDELAVDLGALFDLRQPPTLVFPSERCLEEVLNVLNDPVLVHLWQEDETIGWIYQFFNSKEEREEMRKASQAPRNSYELAVRNQFFTPRYIVEFLTDNTLGRTWYEMRQGDTRLKEECRYLVRRRREIFLKQDDAPPKDTAARENLGQEELLGQPNFISFRARKDPRDLKILDPACGSGHFLLYAFDLLETIYEEAWIDNDPPLSEVTHGSLRDDYPDIQTLHRVAPELIVRHNLYGIDIDQRACQIAALALWLRIQRSYRRLGVGVAERPRITKSNIVCAQPMPGEQHMFEEFVAKLKPTLLGDLVRAVWEKMQLAGEAGSLLKIEEELKDAIYQAESRLHNWQINREFWEEAEERVLEALRDYAAWAADGNPTQRRLFAEDAEEGFAFLDLCRKRFDIVLMNPPFGNPARATGVYLTSNYPDYGGDILTAFLLRAVLWAPTGTVGAIMSRTPFYLTTFARWRRKALFGESCLWQILDLGSDVLDEALVEVFVCVLGCRPMAVIPSFRLHRVAADAKGRELLEMCIKFAEGSLQRGMYLPSISDLTVIPRVPVVYSASRELRRTHTEGIRLSPHLAEVQQGLSTKNDPRYLRLVFEVDPANLGPRGWGLIAKGGEYSPYYDDIHLAVNARDGFREVSAELVAKYPYLNGDSAWVLHPEAQYFVGGLTYPERTTSSFAPRILPRDCYFSHVGLGIISGNRERDLELLGWLLSRPVQLQVELQAGSADAAARHYSKALIEELRILTPGAMAAVRAEIHEAAVLARRRHEIHETTRNFMSPWGAVPLTDSLIGSARRLFDQGEDDALRLLEVHDRVETVAEEAFGFSNPDLLADEVRQRVWALPDEAPNPELLQTAISKKVEELVDFVVEERGAHRSLSKKAYIADRRLELLAALCNVHPIRISRARREVEGYPEEVGREFVHRLLQYTIGVVYGRWDIRIATKPELRSTLPGIQDRLPICPPGMLQSPDGLPATPGRIVSEEWLRARPDAASLPRGESVQRPTILDAEYPLRISWNGMLVDDPRPDGTHPHPEDIVRRVIEVLAILYGDRTDAVERECCEIMGIADLREYFSKSTGFFADHLACYSKSRRQAPIYWPLSTASGSFTLWIYRSSPESVAGPIFTRSDRGDARRSPSGP